MNDDKDLPLEELSRKHGAPIISQLVNIAEKRNQQDHAKFLSFIRELMCLRLMGSYLSRCPINAEKEPEYVALSYTWTPSDDEIQEEKDEDGGYLVESWNGRGLELSSVRNCILRRVIGYMEHTGVELLWIDAHCIRQDTCGGDRCKHPQCIEKRVAIQAMDLVYQLSEHPLALLGRPLETETELILLYKILMGCLVDGECKFQLSTTTTLRVARDALALLSRITQDNWWCRAWTFQENYRAGRRMTLMIPYDQRDLSLEHQKQRCGNFGQIPGELCIKSVDFSKEATRLCLALRRKQDELPPRDAKLIDDELIEAVLRAAGRYKLILDNSSSMTPTVISDIEARGLSEPRDRLAIVANCCQYSKRLDMRQSPSLSVLAMCLLNGEILDNAEKEIQSVGRLTTSGFFKQMMFQKFMTPEADPWKLTYIKGCRFMNAELTASGIATTGYLWKLEKIIDTSKFWDKLPWIRRTGRLNIYHRRRLLQLILNLRPHPVADLMNHYLDTDANAGEGPFTFTEDHLFNMATELAAAIESEGNLALGTIFDDSEGLEDCGALFVWPDRRNSGPYLKKAFVFTSTWEGKKDSKAYHANDIDRHVCLEVGMESVGIDGVPHLRVRRGLQGMCFFTDCSPNKVLFPWPPALEAVKP